VVIHQACIYEVFCSNFELDTSYQHRGFLFLVFPYDILKYHVVKNGVMSVTTGYCEKFVVVAA
jgi:hypothetical protein